MATFEPTRSAYLPSPSLLPVLTVLTVKIAMVRRARCTEDFSLR